ncbi:transcription initiation factor IIB [Salinibaculum rarum]|uniref:transcription initiation factor IIB n=1 Tax=Salinibaculum rarum TaxID=3058903 RepID=UPI00265FED3A|nr:TFIIB-type zinc ribbon-containing protein [Salinibaculum sp. KK48]
MKHNTRPTEWNSETESETTPSDTAQNNHQTEQLKTDGGALTASESSTTTLTLTEDGFSVTNDRIDTLESRLLLLTDLLTNTLETTSHSELDAVQELLDNIETKLAELDVNIYNLLDGLNKTDADTLLPDDCHPTDDRLSAHLERHFTQSTNNVEALIPPTGVDTELFGENSVVGAHAAVETEDFPKTMNFPSINVLVSDTETTDNKTTATSPNTPTDTPPDTQKTTSTPQPSSSTQDTQAGGTVKVSEKPRVETPNDAPTPSTQTKNRTPSGALYGKPSQSDTEDEEVTVAHDETVEYDECPECGGHLTNPSQDEMCCQDCGLIVQEESIDHGPEWRAYDSKEYESKSRIGGPTTNTIHDKGLSTTIGWEDKDAYGNPLSARKRKQLKRLRKWDERCRAKDSSERNLMQALGEIQRLTSELNLPGDCEETASVIYRRALNEDLIQGRSIESMATAALYAAARQSGYPRTIEQVCDYSRVNKKRVSRAFSYIVRELNLEVRPPNVIDYLPKTVSKLGVSEETKQTAEQLLETGIDENLHSGKAPAGMAAAAVYAATLIDDTDDSVTQEAAADIGDVCALTIRTRYRELLEVSGYNPEEVQPDNNPPNTSNNSTASTEDETEDEPSVETTTEAEMEQQTLPASD